MILRALIVDDEPRARSHLRDMLGDVDGVELVGEASTATEAEKLLLAVEHDLVFLDIRMPGMDGISAAEIFASLPKTPFVVFTTAYEEYAARAFELGAADYLMKPISKVRLQQAIDRARELKMGGEALAADATASGDGTASPAPIGREAGVARGAGPASTRPLEYVTARRGERMVPARVEDIVYLRVDGETVYVRTGDETLVALAPSMDQLEQSMTGTGFFRAHRSYLVNLRKVAEVALLSNRTYELVMNDAQGSRVPVSRRKAVELRGLLGF